MAGMKKKRVATQKRQKSKAKKNVHCNTAIGFNMFYLPTVDFLGFLVITLAIYFTTKMYHVHEVYSVDLSIVNVSCVRHVNSV